MQGDCSGSSRNAATTTCELIFPNTGLALSAQSKSLLLNNLVISLSSQQAGAQESVLVSARGAVYFTDVTLQGYSSESSSKGIEVAPNARIYMSGAQPGSVSLLKHCTHRPSCCRGVGRKRRIRLTDGSSHARGTESPGRQFLLSMIETTIAIHSFHFIAAPACLQAQQLADSTRNPLALASHLVRAPPLHSMARTSATAASCPPAPAKRYAVAYTRRTLSDCLCPSRQGRTFFAKYSVFACEMLCNSHPPGVHTSNPFENVKASRHV